MAKIIVAGNWKMNMTYVEGLRLIRDLVSVEDKPQDVEIVVAPPFIHLPGAGEVFRGKEHIHVGAQNCYMADNGAFTGEVSVPMLKSVGVKYVIIGHSERRQYFNENTQVVKAKLNQVLTHDLTPIYCCGEPLEVRDKDKQEDYVGKQIKNELFHLDADQLEKIVIAYEPIWAIGTGKTAKPSQAQEIHNFIRESIADKFKQSIADEISILYGGSVKPANAADLAAETDINGALVGGASLNADNFISIVRAFHNSNQNDEDEE